MPLRPKHQKKTAQEVQQSPTQSQGLRKKTFWRQTEGGNQANPQGGYNEAGDYSRIMRQATTAGYLHSSN
jgi:hypothetical protein